MNYKNYIGKTVVFNSKILAMETDFDPAMKAKVINIIEDDICLKVFFDFKDFEEHNKSLMRPNYFDKNGNPTLRWDETANYPKDCKDTLYIENDEDQLPFDLEKPYSVIEFVANSSSPDEVENALRSFIGKKVRITIEEI